MASSKSLELMNRLARAVISSRSRALSVGSTLASSPYGERSVVYQRRLCRPPKMAAAFVGDKPATPCAAKASADSTAAAEKVVENGRPTGAKWPSLLALQHFDLHLVQLLQVIDCQGVSSCLSPPVEDRSGVAPERFPQFAGLVPLSASPRPSYRSVTALDFKRPRRLFARTLPSACGRPRRWRYIRHPMPTATLRRTPLFECHREAGGKLVPFAGWEMPVQYAGVIEEHRAVRTAAGLFDVSHMGQVAVRGPGAERFLDRLTPNHVAKLVPGRAHYSGLLTDKGTYAEHLLV